MYNYHTHIVCSKGKHDLCASYNSRNSYFFLIVTPEYGCNKHIFNKHILHPYSGWESNPQTPEHNAKSQRNYRHRLSRI